MLSLRPAQLNDNAFIRELFTAALPLYQQLMPGSFEANIENMDILTDKGLSFNATGLEGWIFENIQTASQLVQTAVGFAGIGVLNAKQAYMAALYFLPNQQRQGFGSTALQLLEADYLRQGFEQMLLLVHHQANWARDFYLRHHYQIISAEQAEIIRYGGDVFAHLHEPGLELMAKNLNSSS